MPESTGDLHGKSFISALVFQSTGPELSPSALLASAGRPPRVTRGRADFVTGVIAFALVAENEQCGHECGTDDVEGTRIGHEVRIYHERYTHAHCPHAAAGASVPERNEPNPTKKQSAE